MKKKENIEDKARVQELSVIFILCLYILELIR
jgi:hypothetical protein